ncbi:MAG: Lrp/AsnC family transcriptional regulator [Microbacterium arborescens]
MATHDQVDLALLEALADEPRATVVALSERLKMSRNTVQARMGRLEQSGAFLSYERSISTRALGFPIEALVSVVLRQPDLPRIAQELATIPEVLQAQGLSGQVDLMVRVVARDTQHLFAIDAQILAIDGVSRTETSLIMDEVIPHRVKPLLQRGPRPE